MSLQREIGEWGKRQFPDATAFSILEHLWEEYKELRAEVYVHELPGVEDRGARLGEEAADMVILLFHLAHRFGGFDLMAEVRRKFDVNTKRTWGEPDAQGVIRHVAEPKNSIEDDRRRALERSWERRMSRVDGLVRSEKP